jgi:putative transposase
VAAAASGGAGAKHRLVWDRLLAADADEAAAMLRISRRQVYVLIGRWRAGQGGLRPAAGRSRGGRGGGRLSHEVEVIVQEVLHTRYLTRQRRSVAAICRDITHRCRVRGLRVPSRGTRRRCKADLDQGGRLGEPPAV